MNFVPIYIMKDDGATIPHTPVPIQVLLADDDFDDQFFFQKAVDKLSVPNHLTTVEDGAHLMAYLNENMERLPDVLFLDLNMPKKNGMECLEEIKTNLRLKHIPVVIYSTAFQEDVADLMYKNGAHYYVRKTNLTNLEKVLHYIFTLLAENRFAIPSREKFTLVVP